MLHEHVSFFFVFPTPNPTAQIWSSRMDASDYPCLAGKSGDGRLRKIGRYFYYCIIFIFCLLIFIIWVMDLGGERRGYPMSDKTTPTAGRLSTWVPRMNSRLPLRFFTLLFFPFPPVFRFILLIYPRFLLIITRQHHFRSEWGRVVWGKFK